MAERGGTSVSRHTHTPAQVLIMRRHGCGNSSSRRTLLLHNHVTKATVEMHGMARCFEGAGEKATSGHQIGHGMERSSRPLPLPSEVRITRCATRTVPHTPRGSPMNASALPFRPDSISQKHATASGRILLASAVAACIRTQLVFHSR